MEPRFPTTRLLSSQRLCSSELAEELRRRVRIIREHVEPRFHCLDGVGCNTAVHSIASAMYVTKGSLLLVPELQRLTVTFRHTCDTVSRATCIAPRLEVEVRHACMVFLQPRNCS